MLRPKSWPVEHPADTHTGGPQRSGLCCFGWQHLSHGWLQLEHGTECRICSLFTLWSAKTIHTVLNLFIVALLQELHYWRLYQIHIWHFTKYLLSCPWLTEFLSKLFFAEKLEIQTALRGMKRMTWCNFFPSGCLQVFNHLLQPRERNMDGVGRRGGRAFGRPSLFHHHPACLSSF